MGVKEIGKCNARAYSAGHERGGERPIEVTHLSWAGSKQASGADAILHLRPQPSQDEKLSRVASWPARASRSVGYSGTERRETNTIGKRGRSGQTGTRKGIEVKVCHGELQLLALRFKQGSRLRQG